MAHNLEGTFRELGLAQYLDAFVDQGFDTWDTILDIQESDLDALGVKLGHRRKLQRRIANARGIAPSVSLASTSKASPDEAKQDGTRPVQVRHECNHDGAGVTKRKYRRHPKPDENAPERPPSAYVLFSNKMREDLKSQNLTFTEIAKLVGENWQCLPAPEKEAYESQANAAKDKYHRDLAAYKKTPEHRKYAQYLQEFKERQAKQGQDTKRSKVEPARLRHGSTSSSATPASGVASGSGSLRGSRSSSERVPEREHSPTRQERLGSTASTIEPLHSSTGPISHSRRLSLDDPAISPMTTTFDAGSGRRSMDGAWHASARVAESGNQPLPSLSDILDDGRPNPIGIPPGLETNSSVPGFLPINQRLPLLGESPARHRIPLLHHESSSNGSSVSGSSISSFAQSSTDGPLPAPSLLSNNKRSPPFSQKLSPVLATAPPAIAALPAPGVMASYGLPIPLALHQIRKTEPQPNDSDVIMSAAGPTSGSPSKRDGFDGMSALLRAGEIVGQHTSG
ncbi:unnamed protein product [Clonostachys solani]|uniref:HMG box domain-containing protein n=1 Tax=Clonostachys solani TaxID=160281 RepID=A0A9N9Z5P1_9HYPO|nr:unnamed protein product [Clonostachys solani]